MLLFLIPFWVIGIFMIVFGIKNIKKIKGLVDDYKNNPIIYGKIYDMHLTRNYKNQTIYNLDIAVYNANLGTVEKITIQCYDFGNFRTGVYVELKEIGRQYIINKSVSDTDVPIEAKIELDGVKLKDENGNVRIPRDTVIVNGVEYVRKQ